MLFWQQVTMSQNQFHLFYLFFFSFHFIGTRLFVMRSKNCFKQLANIGVSQTNCIQFFMSPYHHGSSFSFLIWNRTKMTILLNRLPLFFSPIASFIRCVLRLRLIFYQVIHTNMIFPLSLRLRQDWMCYLLMTLSITRRDSKTKRIGCSVFSGRCSALDKYNVAWLKRFANLCLSYFISLFADLKSYYGKTVVSWIIWVFWWLWYMPRDIFLPLLYRWKERRGCWR